MTRLGVLQVLSRAVDVRQRPRVADRQAGPPESRQSLLQRLRLPLPLRLLAQSVACVHTVADTLRLLVDMMTPLSTKAFCDIGSAYLKCNVL